MEVIQAQFFIPVLLIFIAVMMSQLAVKIVDLVVDFIGGAIRG